jgi:phosphoribosylaminoimidazolecarboxamide formyltransferase/IMP cyclohydrolase
MADRTDVTSPRRALLSVTDKTGLAELARLLRAFDFELIASGGTAAYLRQEGLPVVDVSERTGYPEILGGRVKTLHPVIHGGILGRSAAEFTAETAPGVLPIDVVCVNFYRFADAVRKQTNEAEIIEHIDIGGPALLRAAAKNFQRVTVVPGPEHYAALSAELQRENGGTSREFRRRMATAAFALVAAYDRDISRWFDGGEKAEAAVTAVRMTGLRYGENPHQQARLCLAPGGARVPDLVDCGIEQLGGKQLSYNNLVDLVAALKLTGDFQEACCAVVKHTNPCGFGLGEGAAAFERALLCDPVSAFGGVVSFNRRIDAQTAQVLAARFLEIVAAPAFDDEALERLRRKKNLRIVHADRECFMAATRGASRVFGRITLAQDEDEGFPELAEWRVVAGSEPDAAQKLALGLAWRVAKHVKSNAIVLADACGTLGVGAGQMSRVDSVRWAIQKASDQNLSLAAAVAASDGFFPFPDGIERLADAGISAVIAPGGSIRDNEVAAAAGRRGVTLILTSRRHFRH